MVSTNIQISKYRPIVKGTYHLRLWGLAMQSLDDGCFRVELYNDENRMMECFDLNLRWSNHRKYLENYIESVKSYGAVSKVWFSRSGLLGITGILRILSLGLTLSVISLSSTILI